MGTIGGDVPVASESAAPKRLSREQLLRRHLAGVTSRRACNVCVLSFPLTVSTAYGVQNRAGRWQACRTVQALVQWRALTEQAQAERQFLNLFPPEVANALALPPTERQRIHVDAIYSLARKQPFARTVPPEALHTACRHMTYEVLHDGMARSC